MECRKIEVSDDHLMAYMHLMHVCFPKAAAKYTMEYMKWLYRENPDGIALGYDAWEDKKLVAHYVCVPGRALVGGNEVKVILSLNTATHPEFQGRGLFTKLAEMTYGEAGHDGYDCIYGIANANSTHGFVKKLGFQLVQPLQAKIGIGALNLSFDKHKENIDFRRVWSDKSFLWRKSNPYNKVFLKKSSEMIKVHARAAGGFLSVYTEDDIHVQYASQEDKNISLMPFHLYIGCVPTGLSSGNLYMDIPQILRPSPLNLIYRSLTGRKSLLDKNKILVNFFDFDAF